MGNELTPKETYAMWVEQYRESGDTSWLDLVTEGLEEMLEAVIKHAHCGFNIRAIYDACLIEGDYWYNREVRGLCLQIESFL